MAISGIQKLIQAVTEAPDANALHAAILPIHELAEKGDDVTDAVSVLQPLLDHEDKSIQWLAAHALTYHYIAKGQWDAIEALIKSTDQQVQEAVENALALARN